jgi:hypothetical protein
VGHIDVARCASLGAKLTTLDVWPAAQTYTYIMGHMTASQISVAIHIKEDIFVLVCNT